MPDQTPDEVARQPKAEGAGPPVAVEGIVVNAATGQALSRVLVRLDGVKVLGALTDADGRFRIPGVPGGDQSFTAVKPEFDAEIHAVRVAAGMGELHFALHPRNAIFGHVTLSTGTPAQGITLRLVRRTLQDGRWVWTEADRHFATPDGGFRFSGLKDGTYLLMSEPASDNGYPLESSCNSDAPAVLLGFAPAFFSTGHDIANAERIVVAGGHSAEANLALEATKPQFVRAELARPPGKDWNVSYTLLDRAGQELGYTLHEEKDHSVCAYVPDGAYVLLVSAWQQATSERRGSAEGSSEAKSMGAHLEFSVEGAPVRNLRAGMGQSATTPVHGRYEPAAPPRQGTAQTSADEQGVHGGGDPLEVALTPLNRVVEENSPGDSAYEVSDLQYQLDSLQPGSYWVHAHAGETGVCVGDVSAGGQNLARTPWIAGPTGAGIPIDVTLRTDCAKLTIGLGAGVGRVGLEEATALKIAVVPEFETVQDISWVDVDPVGKRSGTLEDLTPGTYRVFALRESAEVDFRDPAALSRLGTGQEITLAPGEAGTVVLTEVAP